MKYRLLVYFTSFTVCSGDIKKLEMCPWDADAPAIAKFV